MGQQEGSEDLVGWGSQVVVVDRRETAAEKAGVTEEMVVASVTLVPKVETWG